MVIPTLEEMDRDGALRETAHALGARLTRRRALVLALGGVGAFAGLRAALPDDAAAAAPSAHDIRILNYALALEYLQDAFYTQAERLGALSGPAAVAAPVMGAVERAHVGALRSALGSRAIARPFFDFQGTTESDGDFLKTAVALEDLGTSAWKGQLTEIESRPVLAVALSVHTVEARHAAWMRKLVGVSPVGPALDAPTTRGETLRLVASTGFIAGRPRTSGADAPRFTG